MDYDSLAETAARLISENGRNVTLKRRTPATYSPSTGTNSGGGDISFTVKAVFTGFKSHEIDGEVVKRTDTKILIAGTEPAKGDIIVNGGISYPVIEVETIQPGGTALLWKVQARR